MPGLRILIPTTGPGTGPVIPDPPYPLTVDDYQYRWEASRLEGANLATLNSWTDVESGLALTDSTSNKVLHDPGDGAYLEFPASITCQLSATGIDLGADFSYMLILRRAGGTVDNNILRTDGWVSGVAGNTGWQLASTGSYAGSGIPVDTWKVAFGVCAGSAIANSKVKVDGAAPGGPGTLTAVGASYPNEVTIARGSGHAGALHVASLVLWKRLLTTQELANVYAAVQAGSPLIA